jgi:uncharacterized protein YoxC
MVRHRQHDCVEVLPLHHLAVIGVALAVLVFVVAIDRVERELQRNVDAMVRALVTEA